MPFTKEWRAKILKENANMGDFYEKGSFAIIKTCFKFKVRTCGRIIV
jgi:hypothetical protein